MIRRTSAAIAALALTLLAVADLAATAQGLALTGDDAAALLALLRAGSESAPARTAPPAPNLDQPGDHTLIVAAYLNGVEVYQEAASSPTLRAAADAIARHMKAHFARAKDGPQMLRDARLQFDLVLSRTPIPVANRIFVQRGFQFGVDGLACVSEEGTEYFTPLAAFRCQNQADLVRALYIDRMSTLPPKALRFERIRTAAFVEAKPGGDPLEVFRGNVLRSDPLAQRGIIEAYFNGGLWLLRTQQPDGSFLPPWLPAETRVVATRPYAAEDHLRAVLALTLLFRQTGDARFATAREEALKYIREQMVTSLREDIAFIRSQNRDDLPSSALLLSALCVEELARDRPSADARMRALGNYLRRMTDSEGRLYPNLNEVNDDSGRRVLTGQPYAEALLALSLLHRVSPNEDVRRAALRLAALQASLKASGPPVGPRTIEALAEFHSKHPDENLGKLVFGLGNQMLPSQIERAKAPWPDFAGGFAEPNTPPQTYTAAQAINGLVASFTTGRQLQDLKDKTGVLLDPVRLATEFLCRMQYREDNSYYLPHPELIWGGFRKAPDDLTLEVGATAEAIRALMAAAALAPSAPSLMPPAAPKTE